MVGEHCKGLRPEHQCMGLPPALPTCQSCQLDPHKKRQFLPWVKGAGTLAACLTAWLLSGKRSQSGLWKDGGRASSLPLQKEFWGVKEGEEAADYRWECPECSSAFTSVVNSRPAQPLAPSLLATPAQGRRESASILGAVAGTEPEPRMGEKRTLLQLPPP